jgi:ribose 5-phosphate isomerase B
MTNNELEAMVRSLVERRLAEEDAENSGKITLQADNTPLKVVTELEVREAGLGGTVWAASKALVTAAAQDLALAWGVTIVRGKPALDRVQRIAVGADHAGYEMKEDVKKFLAELDGMEVSDFGTHSNQTVDYPDFAHAVAEAVSSGKADFGIVVDGAGIGSAITANKVPGIRAAMCADPVMARNSREHNFANVLTLGARMIDQARMREIVKTFLETNTGEERHAARVRKIMRVEKKYRRS